MKLITITQICKSKHLHDATCRRTPTPPRCQGCKISCSRFDKLMLSTVECQRRKQAVMAVEIE